MSFPYKKKCRFLTSALSFPYHELHSPYIVISLQEHFLFLMENPFFIKTLVATTYQFVVISD